MSKQKIELIPGKVFEIKEGHKYLIVLPMAAELKYLNNELVKFFGDKKVLAIATEQPDMVKIAEYFEE